MLATTAKDPDTQNPGYRVALKWPALPAATAYEVFRRFADGETKPLATVYATSYVDAGMAALQGATYRFSVR